MSAPSKVKVKLSPGHYILAKDIDNPYYDGRCKSGLRSRRTFAEGTTWRVTEGTCSLETFRYVGGEYLWQLDELLGPHLVPLDTPVTRLADAINLERGSPHPSYHSGAHLGDLLKKLISMGKLEVEDVREAAMAIEDDARIDEEAAEAARVTASQNAQGTKEVPTR